MSSLHSGVLLLDKPCGMSSNQALQRVRRLFGNVKAGYAGTLDPLASGLLPISLGEATKFISFFSDSDKVYEATIQLGFKSTTGDAEGEIVKAQEIVANPAQLDEVTESFIGTQDQVPPMHSAIKVNGQPLYKLARKGRNIDRVARQIAIHSLSLTKVSDAVVHLRVSCSKGTYIRVLAEDIAKALGTEGYLLSLRRISIEQVTISDAINFKDLEELDLDSRLKLLENADFTLSKLPKLSLSDNLEKAFTNGLVLNMTDLACERGLVSVYTYDGIFAGLADLDDEGVLKAKRLMSQESIVSARR